MQDCVFCKIVKGELPSEKVFESDDLIVIKDIHPQADTHVLIIPKVHVETVIGLNESAWSEIKMVSEKLINEDGLKSFRIETNGGSAAAVKHAHVHLLGEISVDRKL